jgi:hypothetical protein
MVILFDNKVDDGDPRLAEKLRGEMGNIIVKINRAYRECAAAYGGDDVWNMIHPYFEQINKTQLQASTSAVTSYLVHLEYRTEGATQFNFVAGGEVSVMRFKNELTNWIQDGRHRDKRINWMSEKDNIGGTYGDGVKVRVSDDGNSIMGLEPSSAGLDPIL